MGLYFLTLSRMVLAVSDKIISAVKYILDLFGRIVTTPFRLLWLVSPPCEKKLADFAKKQRKNYCKALNFV